MDAALSIILLSQPAFRPGELVILIFYLIKPQEEASKITLHFNRVTAAQENHKFNFHKSIHSSIMSNMKMEMENLMLTISLKAHWQVKAHYVEWVRAAYQAAPE